jgi:hypothetical protein
LEKANVKWRGKVGWENSKSKAQTSKKFPAVAPEAVADNPNSELQSRLAASALHEPGVEISLAPGFSPVVGQNMEEKTVSTVFGWRGSR